MFGCIHGVSGGYFGDVSLPFNMGEMYDYSEWCNTWWRAWRMVIFGRDLQSVAGSGRLLSLHTCFGAALTGEVDGFVAR
jgi:hypothetical protein